jgi:prepilin-type N-terminal cleavage/methylation domain-containing protein
MRIFSSKKGFTLIELLIVIAIIAVLAVAFLPTILGAPAKGRDTARIASLQKIQKVIVNANLEGKSWPATQCVVPGSFGTTYGGTDVDYYAAAFGGIVPTDPTARTRSAGGANNVHGCETNPPGVSGNGKFLYASAPSTSYSFGLYALMENCSAANTLCSTALLGTITAPSCTGTLTAATDLCYAILVSK